MTFKIFKVQEDEDCPKCGAGDVILYVLATDQAEAEAEWSTERNAICAVCLVEFLMSEDYEMSSD